MHDNDPRFKLIQLLKTYRPINPADQAQADRLHVFVESNENCFERSNLAGHVTGSAWLVDLTGTEVLLTHHKKLGRWLQLGGHCDGKSDVLAVAQREAEEESGLKNIDVLSYEIFDLDVHLIPARGVEPEHFHYDVRFALQARGSNDFIVSKESNQLAWVVIDRLENISKEPSLLRMKQKWQQSRHSGEGRNPRS